jgi:hypothetical protein
MGGGHFRNMGIDLATTSSSRPFILRMFVALGLYVTLNTIIQWFFTFMKNLQVQSYKIN